MPTHPKGRGDKRINALIAVRNGLLVDGLFKVIHLNNLGTTDYTDYTDFYINLRNLWFLSIRSWHDGTRYSSKP